MSKNVTLVGRNGEQIYPRTFASNVFEEDGVTPITTKLNQIGIAVKEIMQTLYPVGSIIISPQNPASIIGGTWVQLKDVTIVGAGNLYADGSMGGEANVTLTVSQLPSHEHGGYTGNESAHKHSGTTSQVAAHSHPQYVTANSGGTGVRQDFTKDSSGLYAYEQGINTGAAGAHTHTFTTGAGSSHRHSISSQGEGQAHNNMMPYKAKIIWERTA